MHYIHVKRLFDYILAFILFLLLLPLMSCIYLILKIVYDDPPIFTQRRVGLYSKTFLLFKFRSMSSATSSTGALLPDSKRLTRIGSFLRSTSLDELPSLVNILFGHMSFIGPRPLLVEYLPLYSSVESRRHEVLPGLSGLAQVSGRNLLSWSERFRLDIVYVDSQSFFLDIKILFLTLFKVLVREGITSPGSSSSLPFKGHKTR
tara:strand:+ start:1709 stop:2320 length:612 start_codon:yes stop_codon:yes gene_type:complete